MNESGSDAGKPEDKSCCACPFCDTPVEKIYPFCEDCGKEFNYCSTARTVNNPS
jgi:predicted amidophosphoribosyltransferase